VREAKGKLPEGRKSQKGDIGPRTLRLGLRALVEWRGPYSLLQVRGLGVYIVLRRGIRAADGPWVWVPRSVRWGGGWKHPKWAREEVDCAVNGVDRSHHPLTISV